MQELSTSERLVILALGDAVEAVHADKAVSCCTLRYLPPVSRIDLHLRSLVGSSRPMNHVGGKDNICDNLNTDHAKTPRADAAKYGCWLQGVETLPATTSSPPSTSARPQLRL